MTSSVNTSAARPSHDDLDRLFSQLHGTDWKAPIDAWVNLGMFTQYDAACEFFTATSLKKSGLTHAKSDGRVFVHVTSPGYRNGPAGP